MSELLKVAIPEIGVKEISGSKHNARIIDYAKEAGFEWVNDDETPWCSIFLNWCCKKAKLERTKKANARSWQIIGDSVASPEPGDVVVFWRISPLSWKGHVGIFMGFSKDQSRIYCLGGNQGNQVSITAYPANQLLAFRRLRSKRKISLGSKTLKEGMTGKNVQRLQDALKMLGFSCGTSDGIFGPKTKDCVIQFQLSIGAEPDGEVSRDIRDSLIQAIVKL